MSKPESEEALSCLPMPAAQAVARGATHVLGRGVQVVARDAARCALHVNDCGARTVACGRSSAVLSTQVSTVALRLRYNRLACGSSLEVSSDAVAAGEDQSPVVQQSRLNIALSVQ